MSRVCWVPRTKDVGLPTKFRFNVGPASQPIAGSMPVNRVGRWLNQHYSNTDPTHVSSTLASTATTGRLTNAASMLIQRV